MKLRNKKTGQIVTIGQELGDDFDGVGLMLWLDHVEGSELDDHKIYGSLAELNEEWEDYKPVEPLIKDEKIRKAVRVWAEAIGTTKNIVFDGSKKVYSFYYENNKGVEKFLIYGENDLEELKRYTVTELCGEED